MWVGAWVVGRWMVVVTCDMHSDGFNTLTTCVSMYKVDIECKESIVARLRDLRRRGIFHRYWVPKKGQV